MRVLQTPTRTGYAPTGRTTEGLQITRSMRNYTPADNILNTADWALTTKM